MFRQFNLIWIVQSFREKHFASVLTQITGLSPAIPSHQRGVSRSSRTLVRDAMDAARHETNDVARGRQSRVVLTPRRWRLSPREASFSRAMVARKPGHQGERVISRKTIVQGMPGRFRRTCGDYRVLTTFCTRAAGATSTRHSLRNGFNGLWRALPGDRAFLPPSPPRSSLLRDLNASVGASGPHDFAVRESRRSSCGALASIAFRTQRP